MLPDWSALSWLVQPVFQLAKETSMSTHLSSSALSCVIFAVADVLSVHMYAA